ncbi:MAG: class I SAM-dependent methyltransferase [Alphaproteobacteria bacterium]|nr:class I SAM-dependent methyltransferase [Alphaproteobacteria bacterium]
MDLKEEDILGDKIHDHWYYVAKGKAMRAFLGDIKVEEVLDVGAGSGIFSRQLLDHNIAQSAVCVDPNYEAETEEDQNGKPIRFVKSIENTTQNLVLMMDVLEHVPDDTALLKEYADTMPVGGKILITVPAFQLMWSGHDVFLEHYRRYTIEMMEKTIKNAGLQPIKSRYFFGSLFPVVAAIRLTKKILLEKGDIEAKSELKLYPDWLNQSLISVHDLERLSLFKFNKLFGLSVFCLCEKEE